MCGLLTVVALAVVGAACQSQPATPATPVVPVTADTFAVVNGRQITRADVDKAFQRTRPSSQILSEEETLATKLSVLDELIVQDLLLAKARDLKLEVAREGRGRGVRSLETERGAGRHSTRS